MKCCILVSKLDRLSRDVAFVSGVMTQRVPFIVACRNGMLEKASYLRSHGRNRPHLAAAPPEDKLLVRRLVLPRAGAADRDTRWRGAAMLKRLAVLAGVVCAVLATAASAQAERRVALVIGNSAYKHAAMLRNPGNDANDVAEI